MGLGDPLRGRAALPSPLRGLVPSGGYPCRLRTLRVLRADACPAARYAHRRVPDRRAVQTVRPSCWTAAGSSARPRFAQRSSRTSLRSPWAGCADSGLRLGSSPSHPVRRRCELHPAPVSAEVRAPLPTPPAARFARLSFGAVHTARHSIAVAAPLRRLRRRRFPLRSSPDFRLSLRPAAVGFSHRNAVPLRDRYGVTGGASEGQSTTCGAKRLRAQRGSSVCSCDHMSPAHSCHRLAPHAGPSHRDW